MLLLIATLLMIAFVVVLSIPFEHKHQDSILHRAGTFVVCLMIFSMMVAIWNPYVSREELETAYIRYNVRLISAGEMTDLIIKAKKYNWVFFVVGFKKNNQIDYVYERFVKCVEDRKDLDERNK